MESHHIKEIDSEMRLDRYLKLIKPSMNQSIIEKLLRKKYIKLNNLKAKSNTRVKNGDIINFYLSIDNEITENFKKSAYSEKAKILSDRILNEYKIFEDDNILVINKPSGIASQGGSGIKISIDDALSYINLLQEKTLLDDAYRLVHRLDRETSGVFVIAKKRHSATLLAKGFENREISKVYIAVLSAKLKKTSSIDTVYLKKNLETKIQNIVNQSEQGSEESITEYNVVFQDEKYSFVIFKPKTGRMHQIRAFAKYLNAPILGDNKYGGDNSYKLFLHSFSIDLSKIKNMPQEKIVAEIPQFFSEFLNDRFKKSYISEDNLIKTIQSIAFR